MGHNCAPEGIRVQCEDNQQSMFGLCDTLIVLCISQESSWPALMSRDISRHLEMSSDVSTIPILLVMSVCCDVFDQFCVAQLIIRYTKEIIIC